MACRKRHSSVLGKACGDSDCRLIKEKTVKEKKKKHKTTNMMRFERVNAVSISRYIGRRWLCMRTRAVGQLSHLFVHPPEHTVVIVIVSVVMRRKLVSIVLIVVICLVT